MKTKILITGASGFVGGSFWRRFSARKDLEIRGIGRRALDFPGYISTDLTQPLELDFRPDVVIHAAARSSPWGSLNEFRRQNVEATRHIVDFCEKQGVRKLVYISSSSVFYQEWDQHSITEFDPIGPKFANHYARTKYEGEQIARGFTGQVVILRPRAVFGPNDSVLFPRLLRAAQEGRMVRISRAGPPAVGDLIYIDTLCDYILKATIDSKITGDFNLTNNHQVEIQAFISEVFERLELPPATRAIPRPLAMFLATLVEWTYRLLLPDKEPPITRFAVGVLGYSKTFDVSKSLQALGPPSITIEEGLDHFIAWQKQEGIKC